MDQQIQEMSDEQMLASLRQQYSDAASQNPVDMRLTMSLSRAITSLKAQISKNDKANANDDEPSDEAIQASLEEIRAKMRKELKRRDYYYVTATERFWLKTQHCEWIPVSERGIMRDIEGAARSTEREILYDVMKQDSRWYDRATYSFAKVDDDTLNMMVIDFVEPIDEEPHWIFDTLIRSIGGEHPENYEHIEKLIVTKYLHPETVAIPALLLHDGGGTGKGVFASRVLPAIFGRHAVGSNLRVNHVVGKFNAVGQGMAVWVLNEASRGGYSHSALKALVGSDTYAIEHKGTNPIVGPMTAWIIMSTQDVDGAVLLEGGGADRRWSVVIADRELPHLIADRMGCTYTEAKDWFDREGKLILSDRVEAGRWINSLITRHGDQNITQGLHGRDYRSMMQVQSSIETLLFKTVFDDDDFEMIRTTTLYDAYVHFARQSSRTPIARGKFHALAQAYIAEHKPGWAGKLALNFQQKTERSKIENFKRTKVQTEIKRSKIEVYSKDLITTTIENDNSALYRCEDRWLISI